jgi:hypothetical protein
MDAATPDCTSKCRSLKHALDVLSVVTKGSESQIKSFLARYCYNAATVKDAFGRNAGHLASSCGKKGVLDWLIEKGVDLLVKDKESGWTALHRSVFYGHIDCVWSLLKVGIISLFKAVIYLSMCSSRFFFLLLKTGFFFSHYNILIMVSPLFIPPTSTSPPLPSTPHPPLCFSSEDKQDPPLIPALAGRQRQVDLC